MLMQCVSDVAAEALLVYAQRCKDQGNQMGTYGKEQSDEGLLRTLIGTGLP